MRNVNINVGDETIYVFSNTIGRVGENNATRLNFILSPAFKGYQYFLTLQPEGAVPVHTSTLKESDGVVCYDIPFQFLVKGVLLIELSAFDEDRIIKSALVSFDVPEGLEAGEEVPNESYTPTWYVKVFDEAQRAKDEADMAQNSAMLAATAKDQAQAAVSAAQTALAELEDGVANGDFKGETGQDGLNGKDGANGNNGLNGTNGADGKTAYEIAVINGFVGTQTQWLASLHGTNGTNATTTAVATGTTIGLMSSTDKAYLDGLPASLLTKLDKNDLIATVDIVTPFSTGINKTITTPSGGTIISCIGHGFSNYQLVRFSGILPTGISANTDYWLNVTSPDSFIILLNLSANTPIVFISSVTLTTTIHMPTTNSVSLINLPITRDLNTVKVVMQGEWIRCLSQSGSSYIDLKINNVNSNVYFGTASTSHWGLSIIRCGTPLANSLEQAKGTVAITFTRVKNGIWTFQAEGAYARYSPPGALSVVIADAFKGHLNSSSFETITSLEFLMSQCPFRNGTITVRRG